MKTIRIPRTDLEVTSLCLGLSHLGVDGEETAAFRLLDRFVERGGRFLDTARVYSDWVPGERGRSERILGDWLRSRGGRGGVVVATKGGHPPLDAMDRPRLSAGELEKDVEASLRALRAETIDLYYLHRDDPRIPAGDIVETLAGLAAKGKIRHAGCSNWSAPRVREALEYAEAHGRPAFRANQMLWNVGSAGLRPGGDPTMRAMDAPTLALHRAAGLAAVPYSSQAGGFFSKLDRSGGTPDAKLLESRYCTGRNLSLYRVLRDVRRETGLSVEALVIGWLLGRDVPTVPVVGCRTLEHLEATLDAADAVLEPGILERLDAAVDAAGEGNGGARPS